MDRYLCALLTMNNNNNKKNGIERQIKKHQLRQQQLLGIKRRIHSLCVSFLFTSSSSLLPAEGEQQQKKTKIVQQNSLSHFYSFIVIDRFCVHMFFYKMQENVILNRIQCANLVYWFRILVHCNLHLNCNSYNSSNGSKATCKMQ